MMWAGQIFLGILGMSAGVVVAGGLFSFYCRTQGDFGFCRPHPYCKPHPAL